jgi:hypothetical protein
VKRAFCLIVVLVVLGLAPAQNASSELPCAYLNDNGEVQYVAAPSKAPIHLRSRVVCADNQPKEIAPPSDVKLEGVTKQASFVTDLGPMEVRWSRSVEQCLGKNPSRAVADAASAVNRAIKSGRFVSDLKSARNDWSLVFTDKKSAFSQFPMALSLGGHPGFMIPPNQIYIISDFIAPDCNAGAVTDSMLAQVLIHEMGHVVEYLLLGGQQMDGDRRRAEGFASWFEIYASDFSSAISRGHVREYYRQLAEQAVRSNSIEFSGSAQDYGRAAFDFIAITDRRGISGLMEIYTAIRNDRLSFKDAVYKRLRWDGAALDREARSYIAQR